MPLVIRPTDQPTNSMQQSPTSKANNSSPQPTNARILSHIYPSSPPIICMKIDSNLRLRLPWGFLPSDFPHHALYAICFSFTHIPIYYLLIYLLFDLTMLSLASTVAWLVRNFLENNVKINARDLISDSTPALDWTVDHKWHSQDSHFWAYVWTRNLQNTKQQHRSYPNTPSAAILSWAASRNALMLGCHLY